MLRVTVIASAARAEGYYVSAAEYYHGEEVLPSRWHGQAAELLELHGEVAKEQFAALARNRHPATGERITGADRENRRVAYDLTFSASKSISIQALVAQDERLLHAFRESVEETMNLIEEDAAVRVRVDGKDEDRRVGNLAYASFYHGLSRPTGEELLPEPALHSHNVVFNIAKDPVEDKWKALQAGPIKTSAPYYQSVFRAKLAEKVQRLGYEIESRDGDFEIKGITKATIAKFSTRTKEIEALADNLAQEKKVGKLTAALKARLGAFSRKSKAKGPRLSWEELRDRWHKRLTPEEIHAIHRTHETARASGSQFVDRSPGAFDLARDHLLERKSVVPERELLAETLRRGVGSVTREGAATQLHRPEILRAEYEGVPCVSTREVINEELQLATIARRGKGSVKPLAAPPHELVDHLNAGQRHAVHALMVSPDRFTIVRGKAGVGKSTLLKAAKEAIEQQGVHVTVLAPTATASRINLRQDGIESAETLQRFLVDVNMQQAGQQLFLDEASLAGVKDMLALAEIAEAKNIKITCFGDVRQHKSVSRGNSLGILEDFGGIKPVIVPDILRQSGEFKKTINLLAEGQVDRAFDRLLESNAIHEAGHDALAERYFEYLDKGLSVTVISPSIAEGEQLSATLRNHLKQRQMIGQEDQYFTRLVDLQTTEADRRDPGKDFTGMVAQFQRNKGGYKSGDRVIISEENREAMQRHASAYRLFRYELLPIAVNDRIRVSSGGKSNGHRLDTGRRFTVKGFTRQGEIVTTSGIRISNDFQHLSHDYVTTSFKAQSATSDAVLIAQSGNSLGASNASQCYVSLSRARLAGHAHVYTDNLEALRNAVTREDVKPVAAKTFPEANTRRQRMVKWQQRLRSLRDRVRGIEPQEPKQHEPQSQKSISR